ncbi:MAG: response regulator [Defluviitaleaceae bacterium]|nr:response regulator [Defluviitaleaceae bacterium]
MKTIFVVDDSDTNLMWAKNALEGTYKTYALPSAQRMFGLLSKITPDLILLDVDMPEMDGYDALASLKADGKLMGIPVIFLTARSDAASEIRGFEMGALDFINKPFSPPVLIRRIEMHIEQDRLLKEATSKLRKLHNATISVIADMVEHRDEVTGGHIERTQNYLEILIEELIRAGAYEDELKSWDLSLVLPSAQLHDVGKIAISDVILNKPGKLTDEEFDKIKTHCIEGEKIIDQIILKSGDEGFLYHAKRFAGSHHEKWNGTGYPRGLSGTDIPLEGRLMAIVDVYDALCSWRPYKEPFTHRQAIDIIAKDSGTHFEPALIDALLTIEHKFEETQINLKNNTSEALQ